MTDNLINWSEVSRMITGGDRNGIRANKVPIKHAEAIADLKKKLENWQKKYAKA